MSLTDSQKEIASLLFPELEEWTYTEFELSEESKQQIANVAAALAEAERRGYERAVEKSRWCCARAGGCI